jgi:hypothetical protein
MPVTWGGKPAIWMAWTGVNPFPDILSLCLASVRRHNGADFDVIVVTPGNVRRFLDPHPAYRYLSHTHRADYLRLSLLHRYGGIYLDMDTIALRPLTEVYADLAAHDLVTYDGAPWGEVFGISVFGPTRRDSVLTRAWSEAVERLLGQRHDALAEHRRHDPNPDGDCLGWSELLRDVVTPIARQLVDTGRFSARLLEPVWAYYAAGGPAHDDLFRATSPRPPDTELLILNHAILPDWVNGMSTMDILGSELGLCRLLQYALGCSRVGAQLAALARRLADAGQLSARLVESSFEALEAEPAIAGRARPTERCGGDIAASGGSAAAVRKTIRRRQLFRRRGGCG